MASYHKQLKPTNEKRAKRTFLRCDKLFLSEGPHNRLCADCKRFVDAMPSPEAVFSLDLRIN
jgi:hypothetical protein